jgi:hypothetical protein
MGMPMITGSLFGTKPTKYRQPISGGQAGQQYSEVVADNFQANPYAQGYNPTPQTYTPEAKPDWMTGWFGMPQWGMDAVTGQPLTQEQLQPARIQQPTSAPAAAPQQQQQQAPVDMRSMYDVFSRQRDWENRRNDMMQQDGVGAANVRMMYNPAFSPMSKYERLQRRQNAPQSAADWMQKYGSLLGM